jgi:polysaccharide deacetylase family protein (PEP-CTERM system associated)
MLNAISIDLEDYYHTAALAGVIGRREWGRCESRIEGSTHRLLAILNDYKVRATFFVLGWVAEQKPQLIKEIYAAGHEIACHGYGHELIYRQQPEEFRADVRQAKQILEQLIGERVKGYRAPVFSVVEDTLWALDILIEEGFTYDSSIFPILHDRYGIPGGKRFPHRIIRNGKGHLEEFPLSTVRWGGYNIPIAGGGYLRFLPYWLIKRGITSLNKQRQPAIIYLHPWEIDPQQPRQAVGPLTRLRHYYNLDKMEGKLKRLLAGFNFAPVAKVLGI